MDDEITKNARISHTMLGFDDGHGIETFCLYLDYGGGLQQGAGTIRLGKQYTDIIFEILRVVGTDKWEDLKGKHIRAKCSYNQVYAIGHITEDLWLDFADWCKKKKED